MKKNLYFDLRNKDGFGGIMKLARCCYWIDNDLEINNPGQELTPEEKRQTYTLTPVWLTAKEYDELPESE